MHNGRVSRIRWHWLLGCAALVGCASLGQRLGVGNPVPQATISATATGAAPTIAIPATSTPADQTPETAESGEITLIVWSVPNLIPDNETAGGQVLLDQLSTFEDDHPDIRIEFLPKTAQGAGSSIAYLRSAPAVAPRILPDIVLLPREALIEAAREDLIVPMETLIDPALLDEMYLVAEQLGTVDDELAGLVYMMEFQHTAYRDVLFESPPNSFEAAYQSPVDFLFPAGAEQGVSLTALAQYLAAGGTLVDETGKPHIDAEPLNEVLEFYLVARQRGVIDTSLFQVSDPAVTWANYRDRQDGFAVTTSTLFLEDRERVRTGTEVTWIPTPEGRPFALVSGWSWAVVTKDPTRQAAAMALINTLMNPVNQGTLSQAAFRVPSQRSALMVWGDDDTYFAFSNTMLTNGQPMPDPLIIAAVGPAIQDAMENVLLQNILPIQAANQAAATVNGANAP
jgi:ABC-type glycerol-3-phosphate transport system substrate-binding protein